MPIDSSTSFLYNWFDAFFLMLASSDEIPFCCINSQLLKSTLLLGFRSQSFLKSEVTFFARWQLNFEYCNTNYLPSAGMIRNVIFMIALHWCKAVRRSQRLKNQLFAAINCARIGLKVWTLWVFNGNHSSLLMNALKS